MSSNDLDVLKIVERLVAKARRVAPRYASSSAPAGTADLHRIGAAAGCQVVVYPFHSRSAAIAFPAGGRAFVFVDQRQRQTDRTYTIRHELAHVLAGDVDGAVFLADQDYMSPAERVADLFALADAVPGWWIGQVRGVVRSWRRTREEVRVAIEDWASGWPPDRLDDRAALRLALWREVAL